MSEQNKPRTWTLIMREGSSVWNVVGFEPEFAKKGEQVEVIEYSAFEAMKAECTLLYGKALKHFEYMYNCDEPRRKIQFENIWKEWTGKSPWESDSPQHYPETWRDVLPAEVSENEKLKAERDKWKELSSKLVTALHMFNPLTKGAENYKTWCDVLAEYENLKEKT